MGRLESMIMGAQADSLQAGEGGIMFGNQHLREL